MTTSVDDLHDDTLELILSELGPGDALRASAVCRRWRSLLRAKLLHRLWTVYGSKSQAIAADASDASQADTFSSLLRPLVFLDAHSVQFSNCAVENVMVPPMQVHLVKIQSQSRLPQIRYMATLDHGACGRVDVVLREDESGDDALESSGEQRWGPLAKNLVVFLAETQVNIQQWRLFCPAVRQVEFSRMEGPHLLDFLPLLCDPVMERDDDTNHTLSPWRLDVLIIRDSEWIPLEAINTVLMEARVRVIQLIGISGIFSCHVSPRTWTNKLSPRLTELWIDRCLFSRICIDGSWDNLRIVQIQSCPILSSISISLPRVEAVVVKLARGQPMDWTNFHESLKTCPNLKALNVTYLSAEQ